ncbi:MAG TPA: Asp-tRNA(Asn)/Glu-tRNA(Gln) amidotransferase subunit GatC [Burkholderiales bacterium]|nr:Asp-tRNA(Asn)/Glu-tRNA(Gln) amidotransferase subunit GatC [Burkholderiales bacterium]
MRLSPEEVQQIAMLARLEIGDAEAPALQSQLSDILSMIGEMQKVNTDGIEPMAHARDVTLRLRADEVSEPDRRDAYQSVAPRVESGLYLVPKVIE